MQYFYKAADEVVAYSGLSLKSYFQIKLSMSKSLIHEVVIMSQQSQKNRGS